MERLDRMRRLYFLGIGGIGMSALARFFLHEGAEVSGYDRVETKLTRQLEREGMKIHYMDDVSLIPNEPDLVVWTPAIPDSLGELQFLRASGWPMKKRAEVLGMISREKPTAAIAGTHGKTTTSAMLTWLLHESGIDAPAFLGGIPRDYGTNFIPGKSDWVVMEADEYDRSFWQLHPQCAIVTSLDPDHLDIYGDQDEMIRSYKVFIGQVKPGGSMIYHHSLSNVLGDEFLSDLEEKNVRCITYGLGKGDAQSRIHGVQGGFVVFDYAFRDLWIKDVKLRMPGVHNVLNMTAAITAAVTLGATGERIGSIVSRFSGIERRFEIHELGNGRYLVSDYAHHPEELKAAIGAARQFFPDRKITGVFQPHLYSRTKDFGQGFAAVLDTLDRPILVELYPAREEPIEGIDSGYILGMMQNTRKSGTTKKELIDQLKDEEIEILMILGAGDLEFLVPEIIKALQAREYE